MNPFKRDPRYLRDDGIGMLIILGGIILGIYLIFYLIQIIITYWMITLLIIIGIIALTGFKKVPYEHKGLKVSMGKRTRETVGEGLQWHIPFVEKIEMVDCRERFIKGTNMRLNLANLIPANIFVSANFKINDAYNYFNNYSTNDFENKVNSDIMKNLREFLTQDKINERELQNIKSAKFRNDQLNQINNDYLNKLGIKITNITIESIHLDNQMESFYTMLRQADVLALERNLNYTDALKTSLVMNNKIGNNYNNINFSSDTLVEGLKQLKRLKVLNG